MSISCAARGRKQILRPDPCRVCGAPAWWNGSRVVAAVVCGLVATVEYVAAQVRRRARCSDRHCPSGSWTVYPVGAYPHRTFQLDVVSSAVAQVAAGENRREAAERHQCSRRSVARWLRWCTDLVSPEQLAAACVRLDADGLPPPGRGGTGIEGRSGWALALWQRLADLLAHRGVAVPDGRSGLGRVLAWQRERLGEVAWLTKPPSPRLRVDLACLLV